MYINSFNNIFNKILNNIYILIIINYINYLYYINIISWCLKIKFIFRFSFPNDEIAVATGKGDYLAVEIRV